MSIRYLLIEPLPRIPIQATTIPCYAFTSNTIPELLNITGNDLTFIPGLGVTTAQTNRAGEAGNLQVEFGASVWRAVLNYFNVGVLPVLLSGARVRLWERDSFGVFLSFDGLVGEVKTNLQTVNLEIYSRLFLGRGDRNVIVTRDCRHVLGDDLCQVNLDAPLFRVPGQITAWNSDTGQVEVIEASGQVTNWFAYGAFQVVATPAAGVDWVKALILDILWDRLIGTNRRLLYVPELPDLVFMRDAEIILQVGCDRSENTCKNKFFNFPQFGGFPSIPGPDRILQGGG